MFDIFLLTSRIEKKTVNLENSVYSFQTQFSYILCPRMTRKKSSGLDSAPSDRAVGHPGTLT